MSHRKQIEKLNENLIQKDNFINRKIKSPQRDPYTLFQFPLSVHLILLLLPYDPFHDTPILPSILPSPAHVFLLVLFLIAATFRYFFSLHYSSPSFPFLSVLDIFLQPGLFPFLQLQVDFPPPPSPF